MKTSELTRVALDWAVCKAEGNTPVINPKHFGAVSYGRFTSELGYAIKHYSTDWSQSGPIIEREAISVWWNVEDKTWNAANKHWMSVDAESDEFMNMPNAMQGSTPLIAAMRCYVESKFGDEIAIPQELQC